MSLACLGTEKYRADGGAPHPNRSDTTAIKEATDVE
jgi:hypothetical protein